MRLLIRKFAAIIIVASLIASMLPATAFAEYSGDFGYSVNYGEVTITDYKGYAAALTIPSTIGGKPVTAIGDRAFGDCSSLRSITIPGCVKSIGNYVFQSCTGLSKVTLTSGLVSIGDYAFPACTSLTSINIPDSVSSIGEMAFQLANIASFSVAASNPNFSSLNGVLYNKKRTKLVYYPVSKAGAFTIPAGVTDIGDYAFSSVCNLTSIIITNGVKSIGSYAFDGCSCFKTINFPASVTYVGQEAFINCLNLSSITVVSTNPSFSARDGVLYNKSMTTLICYPCYKSGTAFTIPSTVKTIGYKALADCQATAVTIPASVESIGDYAFYDCAMTKVTIPKNVTSIGDMAFNFCRKLSSISVDASNPSYSSLGGVLYDKGKTTLICCPGGLKGSVSIPAGVISIGARGFSCDPYLTSVTIPESVTDIGELAFFLCKGLTKIALPEGLASIGDSAFEQCSGLRSITIPASVRSIGSYAFAGCNISKAVFLGSLPTIKYAAFDVLPQAFKIYYHFHYQSSWYRYDDYPVQAYVFALLCPQNGSEATQAMALLTSGHVAPPVAPLRAGYTFTGWFKDSDCTQAWDFTSETVSDDITCYAGWKVEIYTVRFNSQGGSAVADQQTTYGKKICRPTNPTYAGFRFSGWYKDASWKNAWNFSKDTVSSNATLYASWATVAKALPASSTSIRIRWTAVSGAKGYEIYRSASIAGTYTKIADTTSNAFLNTGLTSGSLYFYKVRPYKLSGSTRVYFSYSTTTVAAPSL